VGFDRFGLMNGILIAYLIKNQHIAHLFEGIQHGG